MHLQELRPASPSLPALWRGFHMVTAQDVGS
jgi:hypothetical protein